MAVLPDADRIETHKEFEDECFNAERVQTTLSRAELRAAINAIDDFMHTNATAMNTAIPQPARGVLTTEQKALLFVHVIRKRWIRGV